MGNFTEDYSSFEIGGTFLGVSLAYFSHRVRHASEVLRATPNRPTSYSPDR